MQAPLLLAGLPILLNEPMPNITDDLVCTKHLGYMALIIVTLFFKY